MGDANIEHLEGTSQSAAHIGDDRAKRLAKAQRNEAVEITAAVGAETPHAGMDVIAVTLTCKDDAGKVVQCDVQLELLDEYLAPIAAMNQFFDDTTGTFLSTDDHAQNTRGLIRSSAAGLVVVDVTDPMFLVGDRWLRATPVSRRGSPLLTKLTFA